MTVRPRPKGMMRGSSPCSRVWLLHISYIAHFVCGPGKHVVSRCVRNICARWEAMASHSAICAISDLCNFSAVCIVLSWAETGGSVACCLKEVVAVAASDGFG